MLQVLTKGLADGEHRTETFGVFGLVERPGPLNTKLNRPDRDRFTGPDDVGEKLSEEKRTADLVRSGFVRLNVYRDRSSVVEDMIDDLTLKL